MCNAQQCCCKGSQSFYRACLWKFQEKWSNFLEVTRGPVRIHDSGMLHKKSIFQEAEVFLELSADQFSEASSVEQFSEER